MKKQHTQHKHTKGRNLKQEAENKYQCEQPNCKRRKAGTLYAKEEVINGKQTGKYKWSCYTCLYNQ